MALRLRRGTDAERLTIIPVEGELIYTTDQRELWIGDGSTVGGNKIGGIIPQFLTDLNDVVAENPQIGQVLKWDGSNWIASADNNSGVVENSNYKINIVGTDSSIIVNSSTDTFTGNFVGDIKGSVFNDSNIKIVDSVSNTFTGTFVGDGSQLTNLPIANDGSGIIEGSNYRINIIGSDSTLIVDTFSNTFTGNFVGDGSGLVNLPTGINEGDTYQINIISDDSNLMVDTSTNTLTGKFIGDGSGLVNLPNSVVDGDTYRINILGSDSSIMIDTNNISITAAEVYAIDVNVNDQFTVGNDTSSLRSSIFGNNSRGLHINSIIVSDENTGLLVLNRASAGSLDVPAIINDNSSIYSIVNQAYDGAEYISGSNMYFLVDGSVVPNSGIVPQRFSLIMNDLDGNLSVTNGIHYRARQQIGIMTDDPQSTLDVNGNTIIRGEVTATSFVGDLIGSIFTDGSTRILDGTSGELYSANIDVVGQTGNIPLAGAGDLPNVSEWLEISVNGNTRYIPLYT
jgi:hypothetical protein